MKPDLLLLGFGQLNAKVARQLATEFNITAVSRSPHSFSQGNQLTLDLARNDLNVLPQSDYLVFCLTPDSYDAQSYRSTYIDCLRRVLNHYHQSPPKRVLFVSSTSVYGQQNDELVDEDSATQPNGFNGRILLEAEEYLKQSNLPSTSIRFSGIYGKNRTRLLLQIQRGQRSSAPPSGYTNRISEDDAVGTLCHLLRRAQAGHEIAECYLASDDQPAPAHEVVAWIREQIPCLPETGSTMAERAGSKRCSNRRLKDTGYTFLYPTFKEGYRAIIAADLSPSVSSRQRGGVPDK